MTAIVSVVVRILHSLLRQAEAEARPPPQVRGRLARQPRSGPFLDPTRPLPTGSAGGIPVHSARRVCRARLRLQPRPRDGHVGGVDPRAAAAAQADSCAERRRHPRGLAPLAAGRPASRDLGEIRPRSVRGRAEICPRSLLTRRGLRHRTLGERRRGDRRRPARQEAARVRPVAVCEDGQPERCKRSPS